MDSPLSCPCMLLGTLEDSQNPDDPNPWLATSVDSWKSYAETAFQVTAPLFVLL